MKHSITIKDKHFKPFIKQQAILLRIKKMARTINKMHKNEFPLFLVILNGSFMFASDLIKEMSMHCEISFVKFASYQGTKSKSKVNTLIGLNESVKNRNVIVVEDIVDTGNTISLTHQLLKKMQVKDVKIATLLFKPQAYKGKIKIDYVGFEIPNNFVLGYGLDYDGLGRNLKDLHVLA